MAELIVLGQDPRFGWGAEAQLSAFLDGSRALGREPELLSVPHPTFDGRRWTIDRVEALRQLRGGRRIAPALRRPSPLWVVSTMATPGYGAALSGRSYAAWLGTSLADEWRGRRVGLPLSRRLALEASAPALRRIERRVLRGATALYATSPWSRDRIAAAAALDPASIGVLPIPVDVDGVAPLPDDAWRHRLTRPELVFAGRADDPRKNVELLLRALPLVRAAVPEARLVLLGRPPRVALPEGVTAPGHVPSLPERLREASLFVLPSHQEGFGIVAAEALAAGVPVLTTPCGGPERLVRDSGGGVVLGGFDAEELAATAVGLLEDAATLSAMRARGREYVVREHAPARFRELLATALRETDA